MVDLQARLCIIGKVDYTKLKRRHIPMRKAHPHGVQGRRPIASKYKQTQKQKKIDAIRKWAKETPADEK